MPSIIRLRTASSLTLSLAVAALAAPTAQASLPLALRCSASYRPVVRVALCAGARSRPHFRPGTGSHPAAGAGGGFDLADAGIGAVGGVLLSALALGGTRAITMGRTRRRIRTQVLTDQSR